MLPVIVDPPRLKSIRQAAHRFNAQSIARSPDCFSLSLPKLFLYFHPGQFGHRFLSAARTMAALFSATLISPEVASSLPLGYTLRPLEKADYAKGFLTCLHDLTWTGEQTEEEFSARYDEMDTQGAGPYYYIVIEHEGRIVGTGALIVEKKL